MISPVLSKRNLTKIKKLFPISPNDIIFFPIITNPKNLENFLKLFSNNIVLSIPNYAIYSKIIKNQFITKEIQTNRITFHFDFFGISSEILPENDIKVIINFPSNLSLRLISYALNYMTNVLTQMSQLLVIISNKKQNEHILKWLEENHLTYSKAKTQYNNLFFIPQFQLSKKNQADFNDYTFKISYKKNFGEFEFFSSEGVFSKDKIDQGTDFLIDTILNMELISKDAEVIDYFSGIGVIGIILSKKCKLKKLHFIESDLISLSLLKRNIKKYQIDNSIVHDIDGLYKSNITPRTIDFIIANPPTHIKKEEFKIFLELSRQLLKSQGKIIIVINKIIPYESILKEFFPNPTDIVIYYKDKYKIIIS